MYVYGVVVSCVLFPEGGGGCGKRAERPMVLTEGNLLLSCGRCVVECGYAVAFVGAVGLLVVVCACVWRCAQTPEEIKAMAAKMIGFKLITKQTGAAGRICNAVAIVETVQTKQEKYFAILMDRSFGGPVVIASATGGVTIEDIAAANPAAIIKAGLSQKYRLM